MRFGERETTAGETAARLWHDLRVTGRTLLKARGFTVAVVSTLAVGLALEIIVISVVNAYLVRSLPYPAADRLYQVFYARPGEQPPRGLPDLNWDTVSDVVEHPISWDLDVFYLIGGDHPEGAPGAWVTPDFMQGLGISPAIGRGFAAEEFTPGGPQVALIAHALWRSRFGGDSAVIGRSFEAYVSDRPRDPAIFTIVGVLPPDFWHLNPYTQVLTPLRARSYPYMVRLREGVPVAVAAGRIGALVREANPALPPSWRAELRSVHREYASRVRPILVAITAAVSLVLLIACANVALLMLLRGLRRQKEIAVRLALGAGKWQVARTLLAESLLLVCVAAAGGLLLALIVLRALAPTLQTQLGREAPGGAAALSIDAGVIALVVGLTILLAAALALVPLVATSRESLASTMRRGRQSGVERSSGRRLRFGLIALEVAGSLALLVGCGLMVRTVTRLLDVELGIQPARVISATLAIREQSYPDAPSRVALYERLLGALAGVPAVSSVALSSPSPLVAYQPQPIRAEGAGGATLRAGVRAITSDYVSTLGIRILHGRPFAATDRGTTEPVAIVSASAARRLWPGATPLGQRIRIVERRVSQDSVVVMRTVVGVLSDVRQSPTDDELADVYVPLLQAPGRFAVIVVRATDRRVSWLAELRRTVKVIEPEATVGAVQHLDELVDAQLSRPRFLASLFAAFGVFASLLGLVGLYAVIAYAVQQREREVAVRIAVGADAGSILGLFMREATLVLFAGVAAGVLGSIGIGRLLRAQLFGVTPVDLATLVAASLGLATACLAAVWWPARRATRTDPVIALREE